MVFLGFQLKLRKTSIDQEIWVLYINCGLIFYQKIKAGYIGKVKDNDQMMGAFRVGNVLNNFYWGRVNGI